MNAKEYLGQLIDQQQRLLREGVPPDRQAVILALIRTRDRLPHTTGMKSLPDLVTGRLLANLGGNKALQYCLEFTGGDAKGVLASSGNGLECWGERFLRACDQLAEAELVLAHCETGFMRIVDDGNGRFDAWIAKTFRVQKVYPFVLGRYLVHFSDGPEPDRRAAWGTWPGLLRVLDGESVRSTEANPLASLFTRLRKESSHIRLPTDGSSREISIGAARLIVHSSYAAFQASAAIEHASK
jgi:hypothetical protein